MKDLKTQQFGKYQLLQKIAVGGMAELYRANVTRDHGFEKRVAIKKILPHLSGEGNLVKAFIDEAKLAALLQHENIIQIYDFGSIDGEYFIAMEYLFGKDLRKLIHKLRKCGRSLDLESALYIVSRICTGLDYSHKLRDLQGKPLNIIHRDINPQNIFLTYEGQVKIIDFGIAKAASHNSTTHEGLIKGKIAYMSPEQAMGHVIDHRSDIFSTGIILYELIAGRKMFEGETMHIYSQVREAQFTPLKKLRPDLPDKLYAVVDRALAKEPDERYQTCGQMLAEIEECIFELSVRPNSRSFASFIKDFFKEEFAVEESALWTNKQVESVLPSLDNHASSRDSDNTGSTVFLPETQPAAALQPSPFQQTLWRFTPAAVLVILGIVFNLSLAELPFTPSDRSVAAYSLVLTTPKPATNPADEQIKTARQALEARQFASAVALFESVLAAEPSALREFSADFSAALQGMAEELLATDPPSAKSALLRALEFEPDSVPALLNLGYVYVSENDFPRAIASYRKAAELEPLRPESFFNLGYIYATIEDFPQAKEMYARVVKLEPDFLDEALFNLAMVQEQMGERSQCVKNLRRAIDINPANTSAVALLEQIQQDKE
ncbi:MAG: protein kinase [Desulfobacterales bacterium]|jgi:serine/threonine protein kinase/Tfp pilus assembly protein PilF